MHRPGGTESDRRRGVVGFLTENADDCAFLTYIFDI